MTEADGFGTESGKNAGVRAEEDILKGARADAAKLDATAYAPLPPGIAKSEKEPAALSITATNRSGGGIFTKKLF